MENGIRLRLRKKYILSEAFFLVSLVAPTEHWIQSIVCVPFFPICLLIMKQQSFSCAWIWRFFFYLFSVFSIHCEPMPLRNTLLEVLVEVFVETAFKVNNKQKPLRHSTQQKKYSIHEYSIHVNISGYICSMSRSKTKKKWIHIPWPASMIAIFLLFFDLCSSKSYTCIMNWMVPSFIYYYFFFLRYWMALNSWFAYFQHAFIIGPYKRCWF